MTKYKKFLLVVLLLSPFVSLAQPTIDSVLAHIRTNNLRIKSAERLSEAEKWRARSGNRLYNPVVEYDYLKGRPEEIGALNDFTIYQPFDFPTVYINKNKAATLRETQVDFQSAAVVQDILLEAKTICLEIIYCNRLKTHLNQYQANVQRLVNNYQKKLDTGEGNILDLNKAHLMSFEVDKDVAENNSALAKLTQTLTELNNGIPLSITDTVFPAVPLLLPFEQLEQEFESSDAVRKSLETEVALSEQQLKVAKASSLPKMELGYHYQGILGEEFSGFHSGITIPLWENKNNVRLNRAIATHSEMQLQVHISEHYSEIKNLYEKYTNLGKLLDDYSMLLSRVNQGTLLGKALSAGHISSIEYFMEMTLYRNSVKRYLDMEVEYHKLIARLLKYKL